MARSVVGGSKGDSKGLGLSGVKGRVLAWLVEVVGVERVTKEDLRSQDSVYITWLSVFLVCLSYKRIV